MRANGVIVDDEPAKDSKDTGRRSQTAMSKVKEKETSEIDTLTRLLKSLTTEVAELKQWITKTTVSSIPSNFARRKNVTSSSSSSHSAKSVQSSKVVFQTDLIAKDNFYEFHQARHSEKTCTDWNRVMGFVSKFSQKMKMTKRTLHLMKLQALATLLTCISV